MGNHLGGNSNHGGMMIVDCTANIRIQYISCYQSPELRWCSHFLSQWRVGKMGKVKYESNRRRGMIPAPLDFCGYFYETPCNKGDGWVVGEITFSKSYTLKDHRYKHCRDTTLKFIIWVVALLLCQNAPCCGCLLLYKIPSLDIWSQWGHLDISMTDNSTTDTDQTFYVLIFLQK
jgi:hypothetical protein